MALEYSFKLPGVIVYLIQHSRLGHNKNSFNFPKLFRGRRLFIGILIVKDRENSISSTLNSQDNLRSSELLIFRQKHI
jgi:hypothetical protein